MDNKNQDQGVFLNGRKQIIDMLRIMDEKDKEKLIRNIEHRNSYMARELSEESLSFSSLERLDQTSLRMVFGAFNPAIIGLALYLMPVNFQRKILTEIDRNIAERAYEIMNQNLASKKNQCLRAQEKILQLAISLNRQMKIIL